MIDPKPVLDWLKEQIRATQKDLKRDWPNNMVWGREHKAKLRALKMTKRRIETEMKSPSDPQRTLF